MKQLTGIITCCLLSLISLQAQSLISSNDLAFHQSYGQKKFRKASKKIYLNKFRVYYQLAAYGTSSSGNILIPTNSTSAIGVSLYGIEETDLQSLTNEFYQSFISDLEAKGFKLMNGKDAAHTKSYEGWELKSGGGLTENEFYGYVMATPDGFGYYDKGGSGRKLNDFGKWAKLSKQLDDAIVVDVAVVVPFIEFDASKNKLIVKSKLKATPNLHLGKQAAGPSVGAGAIAKNLKGKGSIDTHITFLSGNPAGAAATSVLNVSLKKEIVSPYPIFPDKMVEVKTMASPGYSLQKTASWTLPVDQQAYQKAVKGLLDAYKDAALDQFFKYAL